MRILVRHAQAPMTITPASACRCALRVKTTTGQILAAWDWLQRGLPPGQAQDWILGADTSLDALREDCALVGIGDLKDRLAAASEALTARDVEKTKALLTGLDSALSDKLLDCMEVRL